MGINIGTRKAMLSGVARIKYLLRDEFTTTLAAGSVNGTAAKPGPGTRTVDDTGNLISIVGGELVIAAGGGAVDPVLDWDSQVRLAGKVLLWRKYRASKQNTLRIGFTHASGEAVDQVAFHMAGNNVFLYANNALGPSLGAIEAAGTWEEGAIVLRATGAFYFFKSTAWELIWIAAVGATTPLFPAVNNYTITIEAKFDDVRIPDVLWTPTPLASDAFTRANGDLGTTGGGAVEESGGDGLTWNNRVGTTQIASNAASASALDGGLAIATVDCGKTDVLHEAELTRAGGNVGTVLRYADTQNHVIVYHDGTNAKLDKVVGGVTTGVISEAAAYAGGAVMRVIADGTSFSLFYNNVKIGAISTIDDATLQTGTEVGLGSTNVGNSQDNMATWAQGTGGEYSRLNRY